MQDQTNAAAMENAEIADGPTQPRTYLCADGRRVSYSAVMGGVFIRMGEDEGHMLPQVWHEGLEGNAHEGEGLGWLSLPDGSAEIADLAPGQTLADATRIPCARIDV